MYCLALLLFFTVWIQGQDSKDTAVCPGVDSTYERGGRMLVGNFESKPLKETDLGVAQAFFDLACVAGVWKEREMEF